MAVNNDNSNSKDDKRSKSFFRRHKKSVVGLIIIVTIIICGTGFYYVNAKNKVNNWTNKIYPGITVENVELSGKNKDEAKIFLKENLGQVICDKKIKIKAGNKLLELKYSDLSPEYNIDDAIDNAVKYGKDSNVFTQSFIITNGANINLPIKLKYDDKKMASYENKLSNMVNREPQNATVQMKGNDIVINEGKDGIKISKEEMDNIIRKKLNSNAEDVIEIEIPVEVSKPKVVKDDLSEINGIISSFTSDYSHNSTNGRATNVELAVKAINGTIVMPGDTFSYNDTVGERTEERGYKNAPTFVGSKVQDGVGGGVCQVSTALYRAIMKTGIKPVERRNHSMKTSYSPLGLDAVVSWGDLDYKFKNTYNFPIYISGITTPGRSIVFNIYGNLDKMNGKSYELVAGPVTTLGASIQKVNDPNLPQGKEVVDRKPVNGYKVSSYLVTYKNRQEINKELISNDTYIKADGVVKVGTKTEEQPKHDNVPSTPVAPAPAPIQQPIPTPQPVQSQPVQPQQPAQQPQPQPVQEPTPKPVQPQPPVENKQPDTVNKPAENPASVNNPNSGVAVK